ncbi:MAG: 16S rRNA (cytosine(967)-C(5))-methyltransferase [Hormoscilla sp.]
MKPNPRQIAFLALQEVDRRSAYADVALDRWLQKAKLSGADRSLVTELLYGTVRRRRSLDNIIDRLAKKPASKQNPDLRIILHLGLYQLEYLTQIPAAAAVDSTVELAKENRLGGLAGFVNSLLRQYIRNEGKGEWKLPENPVERLGILHSYPDWIIELWLEQLGETETEKLCEWLNQPPTIDLRVNILRTTIAEVEAAMFSAGVGVSPVPETFISVMGVAGLRLNGRIGSIQKLPGFQEGWWMVQDSSAQLVTYLLDPQPGEVVIDACAAPGGKTTHIAELMGDRGTVWACDRSVSRLKKLTQNCDRLNLQSIKICAEDIRNIEKFTNMADRVLLDAPCSGLGTLHRHADARWRQTPETVEELSALQRELLEHTATWVKAGGILVYATCTLHPLENERVIQAFLEKHPHWKIDPPPGAAEGWVKVWPHRHQMDGFFMVRLKQESG